MSVTRAACMVTYENGSCMQPLEVQGLAAYRRKHWEICKKKRNKKKLFVSVWLYFCSNDFVIQAQELNLNDVYKCTWTCA